VTHVGALWRLEAFLDRDHDLHPMQRLALITWVMTLQDDLLPPLATEGDDPTADQCALRFSRTSAWRSPIA